MLTRNENEASYWSMVNKLSISQGVTPELDWKAPIGYYKVPYVLNNTQKDIKEYPFLKYYYFDLWDRHLCTPLKTLYYKWVKYIPTGESRSLEVGCGPGAWSVEMARRGMTVDAFDISTGTIQIAKEHLDYLIRNGDNIKINYFTADANIIELPRDTYDLVLIQSSIHHISNPLHIITECYNSLTKRGKLVIVDATHNISILQKFLKYFLLLCLPTISRYHEKVKWFWIKSAKIMFGKKNDPCPFDSMAQGLESSCIDAESPNEDVTSIEEAIRMASEISSYYEVTTCSAFCVEIVTQIRNFLLRKPIVIVLGLIDSFLVSCKLLKGQYFICVLSKNG
jgi:ubiquinone/menaquinone biosynthesis C-methylase UbiE